MKIAGIYLASVAFADEKKVPPRHPLQRLNRLVEFSHEFIDSGWFLYGIGYTSPVIGKLTPAKITPTINIPAIGTAFGKINLKRMPDEWREISNVGINAAGSMMRICSHMVAQKPIVSVETSQTTTLLSNAMTK